MHRHGEISADEESLLTSNEHRHGQNRTYAACGLPCHNTLTARLATHSAGVCTYQHASDSEAQSRSERGALSIVPQDAEIELLEVRTPRSSTTALPASDLPAESDIGLAQPDTVMTPLEGS